MQGLVVEGGWDVARGCGGEDFCVTFLVVFVGAELGFVLDFLDCLVGVHLLLFMNNDRLNRRHQMLDPHPLLNLLKLRLLINFHNQINIPQILLLIRYIFLSIFLCDMGRKRLPQILLLGLELLSFFLAQEV